MAAIIAFKKVKDAYGWLGNMSPHKLRYENLEWLSSEALFQALRFSLSDPIREEIRAQKSPMSAKMIAKGAKDQMTVEPQSRVDLDNMVMCLRLKIDSYPLLKAELIASGDAEIIEDCTSRQRGSGLFWGAGLQNDGTWKGENTLGKLWMQIRHDITHGVTW